MNSYIAASYPLHPWTKVKYRISPDGHEESAITVMYWGFMKRGGPFNELPPTYLLRYDFSKN